MDNVYPNYEGDENKTLVIHGNGEQTLLIKLLPTNRIMWCPNCQDHFGYKVLSTYRTSCPKCGKSYLILDKFQEAQKKALQHAPNSTP